MSNPCARMTESTLQHTLIDGFLRDLRIIRRHRVRGITQVVVLVHLFIEFAHALQHEFRIAVVCIVEELHRTRQARLQVRLLRRLADRQAEHWVRVLRQFHQFDQSRHIVEDRAEDHTTQTE